MGEENVTMFPMSNGTLFMREKDGRMIKVGAFENVKEFTESNEKDEDILPISLERNMSVSFSVFIPRSSRKNLVNLSVYGWRAKGPVRKRKIFGLVYGRRRRLA